MSAKSLIQVIAAAILATACSQEPPMYFGPQRASLSLAPVSSLGPETINSQAFALRAPSPGQPSYLETIRFIDSGVRYIDPFAEFFIAFDGQMCFRGLVNRQMLLFENYQNYWCIYPTNVNNVEELSDNITTVNTVRLWCVLEAPQCARRFGPPNFLLDESPWIGNSISVQIRPSKEQRTAIEHLIYLMGGNAGSPRVLVR